MAPIISVRDVHRSYGRGPNRFEALKGVSFDIAEGVVVDTHVKRLSARLGLTKEEDPEKIEQDLIPLLPP